MRPKILIVDDRIENLYALEKTLGALNVQVLKAISGNDALALTLEHDFCAAILDVQMPEMDGYELAELLRGNEVTTALPIIFVSAIFSDEYHHRKGYSAGAVDFMAKPFIPEIMLSKVKVFIDLYEQRRKLQETVAQLNQANAALNRRTKQLEISGKIGQQITSILDQDVLLPEVVRIIESGFAYPYVTLWLAHPSEPTLVAQASSDHSLVGVVLNSSAANPLVRAWRAGEQYLSNDVLPGLNSPAKGGLAMPGSELALPIKVARDNLGLLHVQSERRQAFSSDDVIILQIITDQIAIAIRNAQLYQQVKNNIP
jgi:DNA-binding response OmpR family regulator